MGSVVVVGIGVVERGCASVGEGYGSADFERLEGMFVHAGGALLGRGGVRETLADLEPGPAAMAYLQSLDVASLTEFERVEVMRAWEAQHAWVMAQAQPVLVAVAGAQPTEDDWESCEVAAALHLTGRAAGWRIQTARTLTAKLPATLRALGEGVLSWRHAQIIAGECADLPSTMAAAVESAVLGRAGGQTPGRFGAAVRRVIAGLRPIDVELAHLQARQHRQVWLQPEPDGMATVGAYLPAAAARAIFATVDQAARRAQQHHTEARARGETGPGAGRDLTGHRLSIDELRADALVAAILGTASPVPVEVQVVIDSATLLGLADHPGELVGYGPIPAGAARMLAADAGWRRLVVDPVRGRLLDYGRTTYRPPKPLADFVRARDATCRFPGCGQPARRCDIDHAQPYAAGGQTCPTNTCCLCRRHHRLKTHAGWQLDLHDDGACTWTSPTGHRYYLDPPPSLEPTWADP